jgi:hypothetical protein
MKCVIDKLSDLGIIKIHVSGKLNQETRKELFLKAVSEINTNGYQKLLIDVTGSKVSKNSAARTIHTFDMVDSIKKIEMTKHIQITVLNPERENDGSKNFMKLAQLMGKVHMKHFKNYDEAINWLGEDNNIFK